LLAEEEALLARDAASTIGRGPQQDTPH